MHSTIRHSGVVILQKAFQLNVILPNVLLILTKVTAQCVILMMAITLNVILMKPIRMNVILLPAILLIVVAPSGNHRFYRLSYTGRTFY